MDDRLRAVRAMLSSMAPSRSIPLIQSFALPEEEEYVLIQREAKGRSVIAIAMDLHTTPETVKRRRKSALQKIANSL